MFRSTAGAESVNALFTAIAHCCQAGHDPIRRLVLSYGRDLDQMVNINGEINTVASDYPLPAVVVSKPILFVPIFFPAIFRRRYSLDSQ